MIEIIRTAFDRPQRELGGELVDWEGWYWPNTFGDAAEHEAIRTDVGVWDPSPLRKWDVRGRDAPRAADRVSTNDMLSLERGQVRYAPFCDENGKMVGDGTVFKHEDDHCWVVTAPGLARSAGAGSPRGAAAPSVLQSPTVVTEGGAARWHVTPSTTSSSSRSSSARRP